VEATEQRKVTSSGGRGGKGLTQGEQPTGGRGSDTEPSCHVDPIDGCAPDRGRVQTASFTTFDLREEPGALAAHAGICAGGGEQSSSLLYWGGLVSSAFRLLCRSGVDVTRRVLASLRDRHWGLPMMGSGGWGGSIYRTSLP
jgi:hypothetical protein